MPHRWNRTKKRTNEWGAVMRGIVVRRAIAGCVFALWATAGCATGSDVSSMQNDVNEARRLAEAANAKASAAAADAAAARAAAEEAAVQAREANEKADRIFQRSLKK
jgi:hypothetical protein